MYVQIGQIYMLGLHFCTKRAGSSRVAVGGSVFGQIKLIISFVQILSSMPVAFDSVPWPSNFKNFYFGLLGWVNLDFLSILVSPNTCNLSLSPLDRFALHMLVPPMILLACYASFRVMVVTLMCQKASGDGSAKEIRRAQRQIWWETTMKMLIVFTLLLYPGIATRTFSVFRCRSVDGISEMLFLAADMNVECWSSGSIHPGRVGLAVVSITVYIFGIPAAIFAILLKNRVHLYDEKSPRHKEVKFELGGLYQQCACVWGFFFGIFWWRFCSYNFRVYFAVLFTLAFMFHMSFSRPLSLPVSDFYDLCSFVYFLSDHERCFWFELVQILNKMMMTGMLSVVAPGTPIQLLLATLVMAVHMLIILKLNPFLNQIEDWVAFLSSCALVIMTQFGLLLTMDEKKNFDPDTVGTMLVTISVLVFVMQLSFVVFVKAKFLSRARAVAQRVSQKIAPVDTEAARAEAESKGDAKGLREWQ